MTNCLCWRCDKYGRSASNWSRRKWFHVNIKSALVDENTIFDVVHSSVRPSFFPFTSFFNFNTLTASNWMASDFFATQITFCWYESFNNSFFLVNSLTASDTRARGFLSKNSIKCALLFLLKLTFFFVMVEFCWFISRKYSDQDLL